MTNSIELFRALRSDKTFEAFGVMNVNCFVAACASEFVDWLLGERITSYGLIAALKLSY